MGDVLPEPGEIIAGVSTPAQSMFDALKPFMTLEVGIVIGALLVVFIIFTFRDAFSWLLWRLTTDKDERLDYEITMERDRQIKKDYGER